MLGAAARLGYAIGMHRELTETAGIDINGWRSTWW
jgi:hypothetical protein